MKKAIMFVTASLIFIAGFAQPLINNASASAIEFRLLQKTVDGPLFQLKINNAEESEYVIRVKDAEQSLLYAARLKGKNISQKYMVDVDPSTLSEVFTLKVEVTSVETGRKHVFNVINKTTNLNEIIIAKL